MPSGVYVHKLTNKDLENRRADCSKCGPNVEIRILAGGKSPRCREAVREDNRRRRNYAHRDKRPGRHGLTVMEARSIRENECCAICGSTENLKVDHNHETGELRGVLCGPHNLALGFLDDNTDYLQRAINYLNNPPGVTFGDIKRQSEAREAA